jgi:hypothetical protein
VNDAYPFVKKNVDFNSQARVSAIVAFSTASSEAPVAEDNGPQDEEKAARHTPSAASKRSSFTLTYFELLSVSTCGRPSRGPNGAYSVSRRSGHCRLRFRTPVVMAGLVPAIPAEAPAKARSALARPAAIPYKCKGFWPQLLTCGRSMPPNRVDGRVKPGHDAEPDRGRLQCSELIEKGQWKAPMIAAMPLTRGAHVGSRPLRRRGGDLLDRAQVMDEAVVS